MKIEVLNHERCQPRWQDILFPLSNMMLDRFSTRRKDPAGKQIESGWRSGKGSWDVVQWQSEELIKNQIQSLFPLAFQSMFRVLFIESKICKQFIVDSLYSWQVSVTQRSKLRKRVEKHKLPSYICINLERYIVEKQQQHINYLHPIIKKFIGSGNQFF